MILYVKLNYIYINYLYAIYIYIVYMYVIYIYMYYVIYIYHIHICNIYIYLYCIIFYDYICVCCLSSNLTQKIQRPRLSPADWPRHGYWRSSRCPSAGPVRPWCADWNLATTGTVGKIWERTGKSIVCGYLWWFSIRNDGEFPVRDAKLPGLANQEGNMRFLKFQSTPFGKKGWEKWRSSHGKELKPFHPIIDENH